MVDDDLLARLCCPETRQGLRRAEAVELARLNALIAGGNLSNRGGALVKEKLEAGLVREDGRWLYPIRHGIPIMLVDEAVPL